MKSIKGLTTLLLELTLLYGTASALPVRPSHLNPHIRTNSWLDSVKLYPNIKDIEDSVNTIPDQLFKSAEQSFHHAQTKNHSEKSRSDDIENNLIEASDSYLNAFFYYHTAKDTANARISAINYLNTNFTFHKYQLLDYQRNAASMLQKAKEFTRVDTKESRIFWNQAAALFKKFKDSYQGSVSKSRIEDRIRILDTEIRGEGHIGKYLSIDNPKGTWTDSLGYDAEDIQALTISYRNVNSWFNQLFKFPQLQKSLREIVPDINLYKPE